MDLEKKENKEINKLSLLIVAIIILVLIIAGGGYYIFQQKQHIEDLTLTAEIDKEWMEDELSQIALQYEGVKFKVSNDSLLLLLGTEQMKVQRLQEELRTVKTTNTQRINELKKELETLRKIMRNYVIQIDSLHQVNQRLEVEKRQAEERAHRATTTAQQYQKKTEQLTEIVNQASQLNASNIQVYTLDKRGKAAKKIDKMEQFQFSFNIAKNNTAPVGEKMIYMRIQKPDDDILLKSRGDLFAFEGKEINYSIRRMIEYDGEEQQVTMYWDIEEYLSPGSYRVDIFADGHLIGQKTFVLNK